MHPDIYLDVRQDYENPAKKMKTDSTDVESALMKFVVNDRLPLSKLGSPHLNKLIQGEFLLMYCTRAFSSTHVLIYVLT